METNCVEITYLSKTVKVQQYLSESNDRFRQKLEFIRKLEKSNVEWKESNRLSKIWSNIKFRECKYASELYYKIMNYDKLNY
jgi:hypothetical protein